jgi:hypothetical protein
MWGQPPPAVQSSNVRLVLRVLLFHSVVRSVGRRILARAEDMVILTSDHMFKKYSVDLVWCGK